jgi:hypothetical protein
MPDFLLIFHSDELRASTTAVLSAATEDEAKSKARAIASHDRRPVELWRDQRLIVRHGAQDIDPAPDQTCD